MSAEVPYGEGRRMLALPELCKWLNITEQHARKLVARDAIPYRKIGHLLRFPESEVDEWSRPTRRHAVTRGPDPGSARVSAKVTRARARLVLPKSLIEGPPDQESDHAQRRSA
jgi:excisionase family DNA binding protein